MPARYGNLANGEMPDVIYGVTWNNQNVLNYTYDNLGRLTNKTIPLYSEEAVSESLNTTYTYYDVNDSKTTTLLKSTSTNGVTQTYEYDELGNITSIFYGADYDTFEYDNLNQLVRENLGYIDKTYTYEYVNGNIKYKHEYDYTTGTLPATPKKTIEYHYDDSSWSDVLTSVSETTYPTTNSSTASTYSVMGGVLNAPSTDTTASDNLAKSLLGNNCKKVDITANGVLNVGDDDLGVPNMNTYSMNSTTNSSTLFSMEVDAIGNMTKFNGYDFNWNGRRLESISQNGVELISYKYNIDGQRVSKTVGNTTTEYFYNGDILAGQKTGNDILIFMYDNNGDVFGFTYNGTPYYYIKNAQNDVYMIVDETGVAYVLYMYDAWGRIGCYDGTDFGLATINPLMYRSYYIDVETGYFFYYLNSRYYLADLGRFISADSYVQTGQGMLDKNMFAYCGNNPVNYVDPDGDCPYNGTAADFHRLEQGLPSLDCTCRDSERSEVLAYSEHQKKGTTNPSNRNKHENGQTRRQRDQNGEKKNQKPGWKPNPNKRNTQNMELVPVIVEKVVCTVVLVGAVSIAVYVVANDFTGIGVVDDPALAALTPVIWDSASRLLA